MSLEKPSALRQVECERNFNISISSVRGEPIEPSTERGLRNFIYHSIEHKIL